MHINAENYEAASRLCVENYNEDERNPYYIQPYFETLIHQYMSTNSETEGNSDDAELITIMKKLLDTMKKVDLPQARQMYICMNAEYVAYVDEDFDGSMAVMEEELSQADESSIYLYMTRFDIAYKCKNNSVMKKTIQEIEEIVKKQKYFSNAMNLRKARYLSAIGKKSEATSVLGKVKNMPENTMKKIRAEVEG